MVWKVPPSKASSCHYQGLIKETYYSWTHQCGHCSQSGHRISSCWVYRSCCHTCVCFHRMRRCSLSHPLHAHSHCQSHTPAINQISTKYKYCSCNCEYFMSLVWEIHGEPSTEYSSGQPQSSAHNAGLTTDEPLEET